ncbi:TIGR00341 family protein [Gordonia alkaliphila]|uniref:DUF389 domain-containing protein n=1 Tax=Gordonia alkaliphila TaxID=1053547 RepID=A0ABP8YZ66_9ACTN
MATLIPVSQRRDVADISDRLDLAAGDRQAKTSAFWTMLTLSGVIAVCGIATDSTATVIGAMIVAPLSTPILGLGLGIVTGRLALVRGSAVTILGGVAVVVVMGVLIAQILPNPAGVLSNSQVLGRTSPAIADLLAALATGLVGAIAITRRDVADVLPGVAIAISLVPPLGVVGVCLGSGAYSLAVGALVLFASNVLAMVVTGVLVFSLAGYRSAGEGRAGVWRGRRIQLVFACALLVIAVPMTINSLNTLWSRQIADAADSWLQAHGVSGQVTGVTLTANSATVRLTGPEQLPPVDELQRSVDALVPWEPRLVVDYTVGGRKEAG